MALPPTDKNEDLRVLIELAAENAAEEGWDVEAAFSHHVREAAASPTAKNLADVLWLGGVLLLSRGQRQPVEDFLRRDVAGDLVPRFKQLRARLETTGSLLRK